MHIYDHSIGEWNDDGTTQTEAEVCALTGVPISDEHQTVIPLGDGTHFVRVISQRAGQVTDAVKAELLASVTPKKTMKAVKAADAAEEHT